MSDVEMIFENVGILWVKARYTLVLFTFRQLSPLEKRLAWYQYLKQTDLCMVLSWWLIRWQGPLLMRWGWLVSCKTVTGSCWWMSGQSSRNSESNLLVPVGMEAAARSFQSKLRASIHQVCQMFHYRQTSQNMGRSEELNLTKQTLEEEPRILSRSRRVKGRGKSIFFYMQRCRCEWLAVPQVLFPGRLGTAHGLNTNPYSP